MYRYQYFGGYCYLYLYDTLRALCHHIFLMNGIFFLLNCEIEIKNVLQKSNSSVCQFRYKNVNSIEESTVLTKKQQRRLERLPNRCVVLTVKFRMLWYRVLRNTLLDKTPLLMPKYSVKILCVQLLERAWQENVK